MNEPASTKDDLCAYDLSSGNKRIETEREDLQVMLDSIPAWIFYKDRKNRFLRVNRAFCDVMEMSREELEGKSLFDLYPEEDAEAYWRDDKKVMASGNARRNIIESMKHPKKGTLWVQTDKIPYRDPQGHVIGIIGFSVDITARKHAEEALRLAHEEERQLFQEREQLVNQLQSALAEIRTLDSLLPICAICKKIRDDNGQWHYLEAYIGSRTDTQFTHGYCPDCADKLEKDSL